MTRLLNRAGHSAVHGLAMRAGCACPDCGCGPRAATAFEEDLFDEDDAFLDELFDEDADHAARRRQAAARPARARPARARPSGPARRAPARPPARQARPPAPSRQPAATGPAQRPARSGGRPRQPLPRHRRMTPPQRRATQNLLQSFGWTGWTQGRGGGAVSVQDLVNFSAAGGVRQRPGGGPTGGQLSLTPRGRQMLQRDPRFRRLAPMFTQGGQRLYHIAEPGAAPDHRSHYVGTTAQSTGLRILEHLRYPNPDRVHPELIAAARAGRLDQLRVQQGRVTQGGQASMTHGAEVLLQNLHRSDWNDPRRHGFDAESLEFDW